MSSFEDTLNYMIFIRLIKASLQYKNEGIEIISDPIHHQLESMSNTGNNGSTGPLQLPSFYQQSSMLPLQPSTTASFFNTTNTFGTSSLFHRLEPSPPTLPHVSTAFYSRDFIYGKLQLMYSIGKSLLDSILIKSTTAVYLLNIINDMKYAVISFGDYLPIIIYCSQWLCLVMCEIFAIFISIPTQLSLI